MYIAPTWKLARNKAEEYKCRVGTHASLLMCDPTNNMFKGINTFIIDEVSMMSNEEKNTIINYYDGAKLIFCGDINYQLPFVQAHKKGEHTKFQVIGFDNIMRFDIDYRAKCDQLKDIKIKIREYIDNDIFWICSDMMDKFKKISRDEIKNLYNINDMVLCSSHKKKDEYTTMFKEMKKYYITKTTNKYSCGEILITDEIIPSEFGAELRHAYTVHSIQGETCKTNLFIEAKNMDMRMFYTAISRAQYINQIFIIE
jgi:ATP-dependent exoDNAse (exonuclease V) alpha subunit